MQEIEFLGFKLNTLLMEIQLPEQKLLDLKDQCKKLLMEKKTTVLALAKLIGRMTSTLEAIRPGPLNYRKLQMCKTKGLLQGQSYGARVTLSAECLEELRWWCYNVEQWNGRALLTPGPDMTISTDASNSGWGAQWGSSQIKGSWSSDEMRWHINAKELKAVELAVRAFTKSKDSIQVHCECDNRTAVAHINRMGGTRTSMMVQMTKDLWRYCQGKRIELMAEHIPGKLNLMADQLSREKAESSNWKLDWTYSTS